ncbi:C40 family peptidase [Leptospira sp. 'Mane']|uniref:C40 family peptidase n=1 Tax=Leptospira sp. 'Mane' TaxID=3387407 RepID=UPI00398B48A5
MPIFKQKATLVFFLISVLVFTEVNLYAEDFSDLLKNDYNKQQTLLIRNEVSKKLGGRSASPKVKELASKILPWAIMENLSPEEFSNALVRMVGSDEAGIPFESNEDLLPLISSFKSEDEFLYVSKFFKEAETAELPVEFRDQLVFQSQKKKWDGFTLVLAGRLLILSRREKLDTGSYLKNLSGKMPPKAGQLPEDALNAVIGSLTENFSSKETLNLLPGLQKDLLSLRKPTGKKLTKQMQVSTRNIDPDLLTLGKLEIRERPKLNLSASDLGIPNDEEGKDWRYLSVRNLEIVVSDWIGTRYQYGGSGKSGTDCSGFTRSVLTDGRLAVPASLLPRSASDQAKIGESVSRSDVKEGDLVFFSASPNQSKITHVGLSMGDGKFSHASSSRGVIVQSLNEKWWTERYTGARRIFLKVK